VNVGVCCSPLNPTPTPTPTPTTSGSSCFGNCYEYTASNTGGGPNFVEFMDCSFPNPQPDTITVFPGTPEVFCATSITIEDRATISKGGCCPI
jgi:hypothetical protein